MIRRITARPLLAGVGCLAIGGCSSVPPLAEGPFQQYHASVVQLAASADQALAAEQQLTFQRHIHTVASTGELWQLQLQPDLEATIFDMKVDNVPMFQEIQDTRANLAAMHALVEQYAALLLVLADLSEASTSVDAVALAAELQTNATSLAARLGEEPELDGGWFFGFGAIAQHYVGSQRRDLLVDLLRSGEDEMKALAELGQQAVARSAAGTQAEYEASYSRHVQGALELDEEERQELVADLLELNAQTLRQLELLKQLHAAYGALPGAHLQLRTTVASGNAPSASALLAYAESLRDQYRKFTEE